VIQLTTSRVHRMAERSCNSEGGFRGQGGRIGGSSAAAKAGPTLIEPSWAGDFRLAIDPEQIVEHRAWRVSRACARAAIQAESGLVVVLGMPGTGKTLLLNDLACGIRQAGRPVQLVERGDMMQPGTGQGVVLIDEADRLDPVTLGRIAASNACHVLAALPRFTEQLAAYDRPMTVVVLAPLTDDGVREFLAERLTRSGRPSDLLNEAAQSVPIEHAGGIPRVINMLAGSAIALAAAEGATQVDAAHVSQVVEFRDGLEPRPMNNVPALPVVTLPAPVVEVTP
jgi:hypothetical protein